MTERAGPDDSGVEFVTDEHGGVTVLLHGHPQSYVQPDDPGLLAFEYVQHLACCIDALTPSAPAPLAITHIGGAGLTLPRYVRHTRPGSPQIVLEPDADLTERMRERLPLPRGYRIRVRAQAGRHGVALLKNAAADVLVLDAYDDGRVPADLTTIEAVRDQARVLRAHGVWLANLADEPGRRFVARVSATVALAGLRHQAFVATHDVLKGRRFGNTVLCASAAPLPLDELRRHLARSPHPSGLLGPDRIDRLRAGARPLTDSDPQASPAPPDPGRWRAR